MKKIVLLFVLLLATSYAFSQKAKRLDSLFTSLYENREFNGSVLIAEKGNIIFEKSYGLRDETTKDTLNSDSIFELASVSKQFTAMGIVQLVKDKKINYDDPISKFIPELKFYKKITIENLLHHTSGIPDYMGLFYQHWDKTKIATNQDIVDLLAKYKPELEFNPGDKFEYSNTGYALLALIIQKVSNKSFGDYLNEKIFKPLSMSRTMVYRSNYNPQDIKNYAYSYFDLPTEGSKVTVNCLGKDSPYYFLDGIVGDGMVNSTIEDLLKWDRALYTNKIINDKERNLIFSAGTTNNGEKTHYGFGWRISKNDDFGKIVYHSGRWAGYLTYIERELTNDKTIILLQNNDLKNSSLPINTIRDILYEVPPKLPSKEKLSEYAGTYILDDNDTLTLTFENGKLFGDLIPSHKLQLIPLSESKFKVEGFHPSIFINMKVLKNKNEIAIIKQPVYSKKLVGIKVE